MKLKLQISGMSLLVTSLLLSSSASFAYNNYGGYNGTYKGEAPGYTYKSQPQPTYYKDEPPAEVPCCNLGNVLTGGFYVGIQGGYDSYWVRSRASITDGLGDTASFSSALNSIGPVGGLFLGYGRYLTDILYLGIEGFGNYSNAGTGSTASFSDDLGTTSFYSQVKTRGSYGVSILPGGKISNSTLAYLRFGFNRAFQRSIETFTIDGLLDRARSSHWSSGFNYGIGLETALCNFFSVRGEYSHTSYSSFSSPLGAKYSPSDNQVMAGLLFHFA